MDPPRRAPETPSPAASGIARPRRPRLGHRALPVRLEGQRSDRALGDERRQVRHASAPFAQVGDVVTCEVTPSDGILNAAMASGAVTVQALSSNHPTRVARAGRRRDLHDRPRQRLLGRHVRHRGIAHGNEPRRPGRARSRRADRLRLVDHRDDHYPNTPPYTASIGELDAQGIAAQTSSRCRAGCRRATPAR